MTIKRMMAKIVVGLAFMFCFSGTTSAQHDFETNDVLSEKHQCIIPISAYTATGELEQLKAALNEGLNAGLSINEIKEAIVHLYAYCGFPRSIRGLQTFMEVMDERKAKGIIDDVGAEASPITDERSKYDRGKANLEALIGRPLDGLQRGYAAFAPVIEIFLKEHLFADIFDRDVLSYADRELVTVSVISAIGKAEPMLRSHLSICLNVGFTPEQLNEFVGIIKVKVGKKHAKAAQAVLDEVLKNK